MRAACWLHYQEWFVFHDLSNRKALSRHCGPKEEHQSGRNSLEIIKRDCDLPGHDLGGPARHNRIQAKSRKSIISYSLFVLNVYRKKLVIHDKHDVIEAVLCSPILTLH